ncbi:unnamed protein product [Prorocentrum cordatum]|uniref:Uncharacterized protein n=1 Tax=Prorocentrum cordatum TaxID=2364126 RepID=A0ABN9R7A5_9DINO|nr:unnamed protein product [Polarella glacialis]
MAGAKDGKWEAFRMVKDDNVEGLRDILSRHRPEEWSSWQNYSGKTLLQLAESEHERDSAGIGDCLAYLTERFAGAASILNQAGANAVRATGRAEPPFRQPVFAEPVTIPSGHPVITEPMAMPTPTVPQPVFTEPVSFPSRQLVSSEPVARPELVVPMPVLESRQVVSDTQVVHPHVVERVVEVVDVQDTPVIVEVPQKHTHTITREIPRVNIHETTEVHEVPVHHREEVLNVTTYPEISYRNEPRVTVHEKVEVVARPIQKETEEFVEEFHAPPTVETQRMLLRPEPQLVPIMMKVDPQVTTQEETKEYDFNYPVRRTEVLLKPEVRQIVVERTVAAKEERIIEVPETQTQTRVVEVPEVTTIRKIHHIPAYHQMETEWRPPDRPRDSREPVARPRGPVATGGGVGSQAFQGMSFDQISRRRRRRRDHARGAPVGHGKAHHGGPRRRRRRGADRGAPADARPPPAAGGGGRAAAGGAAAAPGGGPAARGGAHRGAAAAPGAGRAAARGAAAALGGARGAAPSAEEPPAEEPPPTPSRAARPVAPALTPSHHGGSPPDEGRRSPLGQRGSGSPPSLGGAPAGGHGPLASSVRRGMEQWLCDSAAA